MRFKRKPVLVAVALLASIANAVAQAPDPCETQRSTIEINELSSSDKADTRNYEEVKGLLREAQRHWIEFRDSDCKGKYVLNQGGTIRDIAYLGCMTERTEQRTKELLKWTEG